MEGGDALQQLDEKCLDKRFIQPLRGVLQRLCEVYCAQLQHKHESISLHSIQGVASIEHSQQDTPIAAASDLAWGIASRNFTM